MLRSLSTWNVPWTIKVVELLDMSKNFAVLYLPNSIAENEQNAENTDNVTQRFFASFIIFACK